MQCNAKKKNNKKKTFIWCHFIHLLITGSGDSFVKEGKLFNLSSAMFAGLTYMSKVAYLNRVNFTDFTADVQKKTKQFAALDEGKGVN